MKKKIIIGVLCLLILVASGTIIGLYYIGDNIIAGALNENIDKALTSSNSEKSEKIVDGVKIGDKNETEKQPVSAKELKKINDNIPKVEKIKIASVMLDKLSLEEMYELKDIAQGGITYQEKGRIKEIIANKFSRKEIKNIKDTYFKYSE